MPNTIAQYSIQWQRIGNMQSSASSILTVISIIATLMIGVISQIDDINKLLVSLKIFSYSFYISFIFSFLYLFIAAYFVFKVLKPKYVEILLYPTNLQEVLINESCSLLESNEDNPNNIALTADTLMLSKVDEEINNIHNTVEENQKNYKKCVVSSFLSLTASFITLGHAVNSIFNHNIFFITIVGLFGYLCLFGLIPIFYNREK